MKIAINGFGRIGRTFLRTLLQDAHAKKIEVVAINVGPSDPAQSAHVFAYDSIMGRYQGDVSYSEGYLQVDNYRIKVFAETDAAQLPWGQLDVDWVVDCSGHYTDGTKARTHIEAGAKKVLISAPGTNVDCSIVPGVNMQDYKSDQHAIVSLGSCTTNALMPLLKIIHQQTGIVASMVTTTHAYTPSQKLMDAAGGKDTRKIRAGAINIIPTTSGAARMVGIVMPELANKVQVSALRVPVATVSFLEVNWVAPKDIEQSDLEQALKTYAQKEGAGILDVCNQPLVSSDFQGNSHSVVVDTALTQRCGVMGKLCGWYDNEWGYGSRLKDFLMNV